jgi:predicted transcriptional regulator
MATSDYSMFGLVDPQTAQQDYLKQFTVTPAQMGQMDLLNQVIATGANAGAMAGGSLGRLFGGKTAAEVESEVIKQIMETAAKASPDPLERTKIAAEMFRQKGMEDRAMVLEDRASTLAKTKADTDKASFALNQEKQMRDALAALPANATPEQYLSVMRRFGDPDKMMAAIQSQQTADENRKARFDQLTLQLQDRQQAREMDWVNRIEVAKLNNASKEMIANMMNQSRMDIAAMNAENRLLLASMKAQNNGVVEKDVAERVASNVSVDEMSSQVDRHLTTLESKPDLFDLKNQAIGMVAPSSETALEQENIRRFMREQGNLILQAAKGTQTEGDAQRAMNLILSSLEKWSTKGYKQALTEMKRVQEKLKKENTAYINARTGGKGVPAAATAPAATQSTGGWSIKIK